MLYKIIDLFKKYNSLILYGIFGVCTTLINIAVFYIFYNLLNFENVPSNIIAWILAVIFAFVTNKLFVFESKSLKAFTVVKEGISFFAARIATGVLDVLIMYLAVDVLTQSPTVWKIASNIIVIILNYIISKIFVFGNKK